MSKWASPLQGSVGVEAQWVEPWGLWPGLEGAGQGSRLRCRSSWASLFSVLGLLWLGAMGIKV